MTPTLALPNFSILFVIQTDASRDDIGAVLSQNNQLIIYMSKTLGIFKHVWSTYTKEILAIIVAIKLWRPHLLDHKFCIQTDKRSLKYLLKQRISTPEQ